MPSVKVSNLLKLNRLGELDQYDRANAAAAVEAMVGLGRTGRAHFVRVSKAKIPLAKGWNKRPTETAALRKHILAGGVVSFIPSSLGLVVVDVDAGGPDPVTDLLGEPWFECPTRRGYHLYYPLAADADIGNWRFQIDENCYGDVRIGKGLIVCYYPEALRARLEESVPWQADPVDLSDLPRPLSGSAIAGRNNELNRAVFLAAKDNDKDAAYAARDAAIAAGLPADEVRQTLESAWSAGERAREAGNGKGKGKAKKRTEPKADNRKFFERAGKAELKIILRDLKFSIRYNLRRQVGELRSSKGEWADLNDRKSAWLKERIAERYRKVTTRGIVALDYGRDGWRTAILALQCEAEVDPFLLWLEALPEWDREPRLPVLLGELFGASGNPNLIAWAGCFPVLGAIQRAYEPGAKCDQMPVLIGPQGIGKSAFLRCLLPDDRPEWFADGLHLAAPAKERAEVLQGRVIVEAAELAGASRAELESLKAFLTRTDDGAVRLAYRTDPEVMQRRCVIIGTSNEVECLPNDPTGNRRFLPIQCERGSDIEKYMTSYRDQLWAEGLARYREGLRAGLPRKLIKDQLKAAEGHRRSDVFLEERVGKIDPGINAGLTLAEVAARVGLVSTEAAAVSLDRRAAGRLGAALRNLGWRKERERRMGVRGVYWYAPDGFIRTDPDDPAV